MCQPPLRALSALLLYTVAALSAAVVADADTCGVPGSTGASSSCSPASQAGIALLATKWTRTLRAADAGEAHSDTGSSEAAVTVDASTSNHSTACVGSNCGHESKVSNSASQPQLVPLSILPELANAEALSKAGVLAKPAVAKAREFAKAGVFTKAAAAKAKVLADAAVPAKPEVAPAILPIPPSLHAMQVPVAVRALEASLGSERSASYSLSAAGAGGGLSGSAAIGPASAVTPTMSGAMSLPPITQDPFDSFGFPGAGLLLELHLPRITLKELHSSARGSLAQFLIEVREELGKAGQVKEPRISILGIHGRYKRFESSDGLFRLHSKRPNHTDGDGLAHIDEEVIVRFEILPGVVNDADPHSVLKVLKGQLKQPDSGLMTGALGTMLLNATVTSSSAIDIGAQHMKHVERSGMTHMSAMAWPIGISAAFIGILIWLAAY